MKAIYYSEYGTADVLNFKDVEIPQIKEDEVLVKIHAFCINDWDWHLLTGDMFVNRIESGLGKPTKLNILGSDIAGVIQKVGSSVTKFKIGDRVYGDLSGTWGGWAEYCSAKESCLAKMPDSMSYIDASSIPQAGMLAYISIVELAGIKDNDNILINGAGGGVGTFAIQMLKHVNCKTTGVDSSAKLETMKAAGFDNVIDYTKEDFTKSKIKYDVIVDNKINRPLFKYLRVLKKGGIYLTTGGHLSKLLHVVLISPLIKLLFKKRVKLVVLEMNKNLNYFNDQYEAGNIKPVIDGPFKFTDAIKAVNHYGANNHLGKIVVTIP